MTNRQEIEELIERYCTGLLSPGELRIFENWLESDPGMHTAVDEHRKLLDAFKIYSDRSSLKEKLEKIHSDLETEQYRFPNQMQAVKEQVKLTVVRRIWNNYRTAAVAAMIAFVVLSSLILGVSLSGVTNTNDRKNYQELRREVESIKRNQKALINGISEKSEPESVTPEHTFTGSGFAISADGYVLTSYHVIEDARSITLSNNKYAQLSAETVYADPVLDMAVLKITTDSFHRFNEIPFGFRKSIADPGEKVFTLGYPREDMIFGEGSVSGYTGFEGDTSAYQISIPVNPGNSGGPLFDVQGNLLGIISGRNASAEAASFAVKSKWIAEYLSKHTHEVAVSIPNHNVLKGLDRPAQIKKLKDFIFIVRVTN